MQTKRPHKLQAQVRAVIDSYSETLARDELSWSKRRQGGMVRKGDDKSTMFPLLWFHHISTLLAFFPFLAPTLLKCKDNKNNFFCNQMKHWKLLNYIKVWTQDVR